MSSIAQSPAWRALAAHRQAFDVDAFKLRAANDAARLADFTVELPGLIADLSRNLATGETLDLLLQLAETARLTERRRELLEGALVNNTEKRPALHALLRTPAAEVPRQLASQGAEIATVFRQMRAFTEAVHASKRFTDVVSIGIGGSFLGPQLAVESLTPLAGARLNIHFLSNVDPMQAERLLESLNPARTLVVVISKTFTTQETLANARRVRAWLVNGLGEEAVAEHFAAVSAAPDKALDFGIPGERVFAFWDWVGGRYSLWSAVGLPIALAHGFAAFEALLRGAAGMDRHFREAPLRKNLPVLMALLGIWYGNFWSAQSRAVVPYREDLRLLPPYLQQLEMESNGKRVRHGGDPVDYQTAPVVWGDVGTNGQHAFFQLLHQGTELIPVDFIAVLQQDSDNVSQQAMLLANCYAQAEALFHGRSQAEAERQSGAGLAPHKTFPGGRPSNLLTLKRLDAESLGALIALYEHRTFVQGCIWDINSFDQMGVELGKQLAQGVLRALETGDTAAIHDPATRTAIERSRRG